MFVTQMPVDQGLSNAACGRPCLGVSYLLPIARLTIHQPGTACHEDAVWRDLRPVFEAIRHALGVVLKRLLGTQVMHAWLAIAQGNTGYAELQGAVFCWCHGVSRSVSRF